MLVVAIVCAVLVLVGVPVAVVNRDIFRRTIRRRRHRRMAAVPFLFFPSSDRSQAPPPPPAWSGQAAPVADRALPLTPEPGIADLPSGGDKTGLADEGAGYGVTSSSRAAQNMGGAIEAETARVARGYVT